MNRTRRAVAAARVKYQNNSCHSRPSERERSEGKGIQVSEVRKQKSGIKKIKVSFRFLIPEFCFPIPGFPSRARTKFVLAGNDRSLRWKTIRTRTINSLLFPVNVHGARGRNARKARRYWLKRISRAEGNKKFPVKFPVTRELRRRSFAYGSSAAVRKRQVQALPLSASPVLPRRGAKLLLTCCFVL